MRIAFLGKGGSGKTTVTAGFIKYLAAQKHYVVAVDADHNVHLQNALGIEGDAKHLSDSAELIKTYLKKNRSDLSGTTMIDSTPPALTSRFLKPRKDDWVVDSYGLHKENISLLTVGSYLASDAGKTCYHGKLGILSNILHHMLDEQEDFIVSDATAGIDNLGTSLYFAYDLTIFVVEPTQRSIDVFLTFEKIAMELNVRTAVVVNKAEDGDEAFVQKFIPKEKILGVISRSNAMRRFDQGDSKALEEFVKENEGVFQSIHSALTSIDKDWERYYQNLLKAHRALATEWYDAYYGQPISSQLDPDFSYLKVLNK